MKALNVKYINKVIMFITSVIFLALYIPLNVEASETEDICVTVDLSEYLLQEGGLGGNEAEFTGENSTTLDEKWLSSDRLQLAKDTIYNGLKNKSASIDLSAYNILYDDEFSRVYYSVINQHPEFFYVSGVATYHLSSDRKYVVRIDPYYSSEYTDADINAFNQKIDEIIAGVDNNWPTIEKILYLYDYLITNVEYDVTYTNYDAYDAFIKKSCVCQGYTLAFICLMNNIDVDASYVRSSHLGHAWNLVELDGENYYVDATFDDPVGERDECCRHRNFMLDQESLYSTGHGGTDWYSEKYEATIYNQISTSSKYMDYFWTDGNIDYAIPLIGTKAAFFQDKMIGIYDFATNTTEFYDSKIPQSTISTFIQDKFRSWILVWDSSILSKGNSFYYYSGTDIYSMDLNGNVTKLYTLSEEEAELGYIYDIDFTGNTLTYTVALSATDTNIYESSIRISTNIDKFVTRMYQQCLSRDPDQTGLDGWVSQLEGGYMNGAQIAEQFVFSNEMLSKNLSNEEFVNVLYRAMMGREADEAGKAGWVNELENGYLTRSQVTKSFVESTEFSDICNSYGIIRGNYDASVAPIEHFVTRFYTLCLERQPDQAGLYGWVGNLKNQSMNGAQIAEQFFFSNEFINKGITDEKYIELLYNTLMGRTSDEAGKTGWIQQLKSGSMSRKDILKSFIESKEFTGICETYGIMRGSL